MCKDKLLELTIEIAKYLYDNSFDHGLPHVERVYKWALRIVESENLQVHASLLKTSVFLHDVGRCIGEPHAYYSALIAEELLKEAGCTSAFIEEVVSAILSHSYSYARSKPAETVLAKVISDADKLDALGVVGFIRVFIFGDRHGRALRQSVDHFHDKILKLSNLMYYNYSRKVSSVLNERTRLLLRMLLEELNHSGLKQ